jgi:hypothetical protein
MSFKEYEMPIVINARTNGSGLWSKAEELITVYRLVLSFNTDDEDSDEYHWGELMAFFETDNWNVRDKGLIYTDKQWMEEFTNGLFKDYNFNIGAITNIGYSEQGMQGMNYVSMDVGKDFINDWLRIQRGKP